MIKIIELDNSINNRIHFYGPIETLYDQWSMDFSGDWNNHDRIFANFFYKSSVHRYINQFFELSLKPLYVNDRRPPWYGGNLSLILRRGTT